MEDPIQKNQNKTNPEVLSVLQALKQASHDLQTHPTTNSAESNSAAIKALLELRTESDALLSKDPLFSNLSQHLTTLKTLVETLKKSQNSYGLRSFLNRRVSTHSISRVAESIESEIQVWIDRETIEKLVKLLKERPIKDEDELVQLLSRLEDRVMLGFDRDLQDMVLKSKVFGYLHAILCDPNASKRVREQAAFAISSLIRFNKDVFVGQVLMSETLKALISISSGGSLEVLCTLIKSIKSPLVDEIESNGEIPKIINLLSFDDLGIKVIAMDCILEIGYFGRREAIEAMLSNGLIKRLVELQRSELGGDLIDLGRFEEEEDDEEEGGEINKGRSKSRQKRTLGIHPFASCVARFAVQLEVGEGLRQREKRMFKQEILVRVKEACISDAEAATIVAEVLWGSSP